MCYSAIAYDVQAESSETPWKVFEEAFQAKSVAGYTPRGTCSSAKVAQPQTSGSSRRTADCPPRAAYPSQVDAAADSRGTQGTRGEREGADRARKSECPFHDFGGLSASQQLCTKHGCDCAPCSRKRMKSKPKPEERLMTQEELLAEAAQTEIRNIASLQKMIAREEETKARAMMTKSVYQGALFRYRSFQQNGEAQVRNHHVSTVFLMPCCLHARRLQCRLPGDKMKPGCELMSQVTLEVCNMKLPKHMRSQKAPIPPPKHRCIITGMPGETPAAGVSFHLPV